MEIKITNVPVMKNQRILLIASLLLSLCVYEKQASNKAERVRSVEKMYNYPEVGTEDALLSTRNSAISTVESKKLYDFTQALQPSGKDSIQMSSGSGKLTSQAIF